MSGSSPGETGLLKSVESISNIIYGPLLVSSPALFPEQISHIGALGRCWAPIKTFWADVARQEIAPSTPQTSTQGQKQVYRVKNRYTGSQTGTQCPKQVHRVTNMYTGSQTGTQGHKQVHRVINRYTESQTGTHGHKQLCRVTMSDFFSLKGKFADTEADVADMKTH